MIIMYQNFDFSFIIWSVVILFSAMVLTIVVKEIYEHVMEKKGKKKKIEYRMIKKGKIKSMKKKRKIDENE